MAHDSEPTSSESQAAVTQLLVRAQRGDAKATDELFPIVYEELRALADRFMQGESRAQTMQATALVHEAYLRLVGPNQTPWDSRAHFFGAASRAIRRILVDRARERNRLKRGGGQRSISLDEALLVASEGEGGGGSSDAGMVCLDDALTKLAKLDANKARVVELRFFAGLTVEQTALAMGTSLSTVAREWQFARVWLHREVSEQLR